VVVPEATVWIVCAPPLVVAVMRMFLPFVCPDK
jgi:hypothetical protein